MPLPDPSLEPAVRDPKKLRNTALVLVGIMILGGSLVTLAYSQWTESQAKNDRPAVINRITPERDLRMNRQDGKTVDLVGDRHHVIAVNVLSLRNPEAARLSMEAMQRLAASRPGRDDFELVTLVLDPAPAEKLVPELKAAAEKYHATLPRWTFASNEPRTLHKFIYNQLKSNIYPIETGGVWKYDASIVLIDRDGNIRHAVVPQKRGGQPYVATFDFEQAAGWDEQGVLTRSDKSNVELLETLLNATIDKLLTEQPAAGQNVFEKTLLPSIALLLLVCTALMVAFRRKDRASNPARI
jgi:hypothetical protein